MPERVRRSFLVTGKVQGVGFRYFVKHTAETLGLSGNVRNCADGTVAGEVEGDITGVEAFLAALRKGPIAARVATVLSNERAAAAGSLSNERDFKIV